MPSRTLRAAGLHATVLEPDDPDAGSSNTETPVLFCHGLFGQGRNWTSIGRAVAEQRRVALIDLPDHGRSDWTDEVGYPALADRLADALTELDRSSAGDRGGWAAVGHSMGGKIAMQLALRHPALVERLCVVDIAPIDYGGRGEFDRYVRAMRGLDLTALESRDQADRQLAESIASTQVRSFLLQNLRRDGDGWRWQMNLRLLGDRLDVLSGWPQTSGRYPGPVLWVGGAESDYIGPEDTEPMRRLFPAVRSVTVKNARHWVHSDQPEVFTRVLQAFLRR